MAKRLTGIYKIVSPSGKTYIGQSVDIPRRFGAYRRLYKVSGQSRLFNSFLKYGVANHSFEILRAPVDKEDLNPLERLYIAYYQHKGHELLNLTDGGDSGQSFCEESRLKMARSQLGKKQSAETIQKRIAKTTGKKRSDEYRLRASERMKGTTRPEESKNKQRLAMTGRKLTPEHIEKVRQVHLGRKATEASKEKMRNRIISQETRRRMSESNIGRIISIEQRIKASKPIIQYDLSGNMIAEFHGAGFASDATGIPRRNINNCAIGACKTAGGYIFKLK